jgi:hypothetical protein
MATPFPTPTPAPRPVAMTIQPDPILTQIPLFDPKFSVVARLGRELEGFCVRTNQQHYWEPGDLTETAQPHPIEITVDDEQIFSGDDLFIFWNNASIQEVRDVSGNLIGSYLASPMHICFSTRTLSVGAHYATIEITSTSGISHKYDWEFQIEPITRQTIDPIFLPTVEALQHNPVSIPSYIFRADDMAHYIPPFAYNLPSNEGVCIVINERGFWLEGDSPSLLSARLRQNIVMTIDNISLPGSSIGYLESDIWGNVYDEQGEMIGNYWESMNVCVDTNAFSTGHHVATITIPYSESEIYEYSWVFRIE